MNIRRANENDIPRLIELLEQVLQIHADIRPDIFIPGTTKYTNEELSQMIKDDTRPIYVAADENDNCLGYASVSCRSSHFPTIWCRLPRFLSMICVSMQVPEDSTSERSCLCM